jgi:hypothetical protein
VLLGVELISCIEKRHELVRLQYLPFASLDWLTRSATAGNVARDPAGILGFIEDQRESAQGLVDRVVSG